ncbi:hypothetical protein Tco_1426228 [Tanacetum coccineum]
MNKVGTKISKLDRFLISHHIKDTFSDVKVTALSHGWSDHTPIMLHSDKVDYGPMPFKFFHSWLHRDRFDDCIKKAYVECLLSNLQMPFYEKIKFIKQNIKVWNHHVKSIEVSRKQEVLMRLIDIEEKIDSNIAPDGKKEEHVKLLKERDDIQQLEDMDLVQKAKVKWDVEGDENTKNFTRDFETKKTSSYDSLMELSPVVPIATLNHDDNMGLEKRVSEEEIRLAVWDYGSQKSLRPDGFSFFFLKNYWDLLKEDVVKAVRSFFYSFVMPRGENSSFIKLIPKIANPIHIKDFHPISLIGMQYKIIAKILANRLSKVIDKVVSLEQSAFISGRKILDGLIMLSELMS